MFESITFDLIMSRMLNRINDDMDKREGSIIYDALAPAAVELQLAYLEMDNMLNEVFADTASREYLIRRASEKGITPKEATNAVLEGNFEPISLAVLNKRFSCGNLNYTVIEKISDGVYKLQCETAGADSNDNLGILVPIEYIEGLTNARLVRVLIPGEDEEATEVFRKRYLDSLKNNAFGGNIADYKERVLAINGVGGVKVRRAEDWQGAGTVKLIIQDSDYDVPTSTLINKVKEEIDPNNGDGTGIAPIGHIVTVAGVDKVDNTVSSKLTFQDGYTYENVKDDILKVIIDYYKELNKSWQDADCITISISQIVIRIMSVEGVKDVDISQTYIGDRTGNATLEFNEIIDLDKNSTYFKFIEE